MESELVICEALQSLLDKKPKNLLVLGDFNLPHVRWVDGLGYTPQCHESHATNSPLLNYLAENTLYQFIESPTRFRDGQTPSLLDLVITDDPEQILSIDHLPPIGASDHVCLLTTLQLSPPSPDHICRRYTDYEKIREELRGMHNWDALFEDKTTNDSWNLFKEIMLKHEEKYTTISYVKRPRTLPYLTRAIKREMNRKKKYWTKYRQTNSQDQHQKFRRARNRLRKLTRNSIKKHEDIIAAETKSNPKKFWNYASSGKPGRHSIPYLTTTSGKITDYGEIAETLNRQYSSVYTVENCTNVPAPPEYPVKVPMPMVVICQSDVQKRLKKLDPSKSKGPDGIHPRLLKETAEAISLPLTLIFRKSLEEKVVPSDWKKATVIPVHKKGPKDKAENYRPISLTSVSSKILEGIVNDAITKHLKENNIMSPNQHGFRTDHSTDSNLIQSYEEVTKLLEKGISVDVILLDQAKAFDKVAHQRLKRKLQACHIHPDIIEWIADFLAERIQRVAVTNDKGIRVLSSPVAVLSGVPQGTVLGPTLFNVYINDAPQLLRNLLTLYADDSKLIGAASSSREVDSIQADLDRLNDWAKQWLLEFNSSKCKVMHFGNKNTKHTYTMLNPITSQREPLAAVTEERDLGVIVDHQLKFHSHTEKIVASANRALGIIKRTFTTRSPRTITKLYKGLVRPRLETGMSIASPFYKGDRDMIEKVQRRATKIVDGCQHLPYQTRLRTLNLCSMTYRRKRGDMIHTYKLIKNNPTHDLFIIDSAQRTRGHSKKITKLNAQKRERHHFLTNRVVDLWNSLSEDTVSSKTIEEFKVSLDKEWSTKPWRLEWDALESQTRA